MRLADSQQTVSKCLSAEAASVNYVQLLRVFQHAMHVVAGEEFFLIASLKLPFFCSLGDGAMRKRMTTITGLMCYGANFDLFCWRVQRNFEVVSNKMFFAAVVVFVVCLTCRNLRKCNIFWKFFWNFYVSSA